MRLLHTADWHLGRIFHGVHLTGDQAHALDQLLLMVQEVRPDAVLISGDIYDRAVPPPDAVSLLDDVLSRLVLRLKVPVIISAGNHDSPHRLGFGNQLLRRQGLHVVGVMPPRPEELRVSLEDRHGPLQVYALPYAEPPMVRAHLGDRAGEADTAADADADPDETSGAAAQLQLDLLEPRRPGERDDGEEDHGAIRTHDEATRARVARLRAIHPAGQRAVLMAHAFVEGGRTSDSERPISFSSQGLVSAARFEGFDYVALGHLHRPQQVTDSIHYAGSLLKYSFAEADDLKSASLVELDARGRSSVEVLPLTPRRDLRRIEGTLAELLARPAAGQSAQDYLLVSLLDRGPILDAMGRLHEVYPNVLHIERPALGPEAERLLEPSVARGQLDETELFASFFGQVTGEELSEEQQRAFSAIVNELRRTEREAS
jgi:exonuclease SbcD